MYPLSKLTENFRKALTIAGQTAAELGTDFIGSEHFIYAVLCMPECEACKILVGEGVTKQEYGALFIKSVNPNCACKGLTPRVQLMYEKAVQSAEKEGVTAGTAHMLYQLLCVPECIGVRFLERFADIAALKSAQVVLSPFS